MKLFHALPLAVCTLLAAPWASAQSALYWTGGSGNSVQASAANGSGVADLQTSLSTVPWGITYGADGVFFSGQNGAIWRMDANGSNFSDVAAMNVPRGIVQTDDSVYIANANGRIFQGTYNGTTLTLGSAIVAINGASFQGLTADANYLYWTDITNHLIQRSDLNGGNVTTLVSSGLNTPHDIQATASYLYWTDQANNVIQRSALDGSNVTTLVNSTFLSSPTGLFVTADSLYFTQLNLGVYRSDLNGSNISQLVTGGSGYRFLDGPLSAVPEPSSYATLLGCAALFGAMVVRRKQKDSGLGV